jgi:hypothetical protein
MKRALPFSGFSNKKYVKNIYSLETIINAILYNHFDAYDKRMRRRVRS